jgi:serine/threonine-protein kinase
VRVTRAHRVGVRALLFASLAAASGLGSRPAVADVTKGQCVDANSAAQSLRREGRLGAARERLLACANPSCPAIVRDDCARRLDELERAQPTIAFDVKDAAGSDVSAVSVTLDGQPLTETLEGRALSADPGKHTFTFTVAGHAPVTRALVLTEGEKGRREHIVLPGAGPAPSAPPPAPAPSSTSMAGPPTSAAPPPLPDEAPAPSASGGMGTQKILGLVTGGAGVVGLALGAAFGVMSSSAWNNAKSACGGNPSQCMDVSGGQSDRSTALGEATASTVGFIAGGALLATGAVLFLTGGSRQSATGLALAPAVGPRQAGLALGGAF